VRAGDVIVAIDGEPVDGASLLPTIEAMRGEPGSEVLLTVRREEIPEPLDFELRREIIEVASVEEEMLEPGFGYIRISQFQNRTGTDLALALGRLRARHGGDLDGLVLDLRNNPGGVLQASVEVADAFLAGGRIVYTEGRLAGAQSAFDADVDDLSGGTPLVVLVNEGSASAAEIVAGALQDHHRAVIMGTPSFGKGSVQTVLPLSDDRAIKLTTALYYTPNGRSIQAQGIVPDITVERARIRASEARTRPREADLPGHLDGPGEDRAEDGAGKPSALQSDDYQVAEALNLLKGLHLLSMRAGD
jgi:carboxyl-terminal processing protease